MNKFNKYFRKTKISTYFNAYTFIPMINRTVKHVVPYLQRIFCKFEIKRLILVVYCFPIPNGKAWRNGIETETGKPLRREWKLYYRMLAQKEIEPFDVLYGMQKSAGFEDAGF